MNKLSMATLIGMLCLSMFSVFTIHRAVSSSSQEPILEWERTYGGSSADFASALIQTMDGGYAMAGRRMSGGGWDFWFFKVNATGDEQWERTYGGSNAAAYSLVQTADGGYALAGYTNDGYIWLVRTDADGNLVWSKTYGGTYREQAYSLIQTRDGGFAMVGFRHLGGSSPYDFYFLKTDENGTEQWGRSFGDLGDDVARSIVETADGYAIAGYKDAKYFWLVKTDTNGVEMWNKTYGEIGSQNAYSLATTKDGGYVIAGWTESLGAGGKDFWLVKTDTYGNMMWNKTYGGHYDEWAHSVIQTDDGGYALVGYTDSFGASGHDFWLVKTDEDGNVQWTSRYGKEYDDYAYSVIQTNDGGYAIAGGVALYSPIPPDAWLIKLAPPISWDYVFKDTKRGTMLKISTDDKYFQFVAPGKDFGVKYDPKMFVKRGIIIICYGDAEMRLTAIAVDGDFDFCSAVAYDKQTKKTYLLIDNPNLRGCRPE